MSHFDDQVDASTELFQKVALSYRKPELPFIGACHNCDTPLDRGIFCDNFCAEDHEKRHGN